ncbi:MAG TPA: NADH-quinone oxidoreductase subunit N [Acidimicrobiales bacterium]|nr:NADH-quinone oxidoreductase subunit N [Acidimicrobiales bacterium]
MTMLAAVAHLLIPKIAYVSILPVLVLLGGAMAILAASALSRRTLSASATTTLTLLTALAALSVSLVQWVDVRHHGPHVAIDGAVVQDGFSALVAVLVSCAVFISALVGDTWVRREEVSGPEFHVLMLVSAAGAVIMGSANDLIVVFLGLEILSIALYVLAAFNTKRPESGEAGLKYFVLGGFSSAVFVYGIALTYGATGTTNLPQIADYLARNVLLHDGLLLAGMALLLVGFGFKVAAVPFHMWTPDVYQGSPTPVTGFMSAVAKAGGFAALLRVFVSSFGIMRADWQPAIWVLAAVTLVLGAVVALVQRDVKRMLAYSSINHAGFVLLGLQAATGRGVQGSLYYLFAYTFMVLGSFAVITVVGGRGDRGHDLEQYRGLGRRAPWLAGAFALLLVAQAGVPFTTGFLAKLEVVSASVGARSTALAVVAMVSAAIAAFFYLRVVLLMYGVGDGAAGTSALGAKNVGAPEPGVAAEVAGSSASSYTEVLHGEERGELMVIDAEAAHGAPVAVPRPTALAIGLCVAVTVLFGLWPAPLIDFAHQATLLFA